MAKRILQSYSKTLLVVFYERGYYTNIHRLISTMWRALVLSEYNFTVNTVPRHIHESKGKCLVADKMVAARRSVSNASVSDVGPRELPSRTVCFNAIGSQLAIGTFSSSIHIWDTSREIAILSGHSAAVTRVRYHPVNHSELLSASKKDSTIRLWDVRVSSRNGTPTGKIETRTRPVTADWNPVQSHYFLVLEKNGDVKVYDKRKISATSKDAAVFTIYSKSIDQSPPECCLFDPSGNFLVTGTTSIDGLAPINIWSWKEDKDSKLFSYPAHTGMVLSMSFSSDGEKLITAGLDAMVGIWNVKTMCCSLAISQHARYAFVTSFAPDNTTFATSTQSESFLSDASSGTVIGDVPLGNRPRSAVTEDLAFHPKSQYLLACAKGENKPLSSVALVKFDIS